jgi:hypothetical protein
MHVRRVTPGALGILAAAFMVAGLDGCGQQAPTTETAAPPQADARPVEPRAEPRPEPVPSTSRSPKGRKCT